MDLKEIMAQQNFAVVGDTLKEGKYAALIKKQLQAQGYTAYGVGKELASLNQIEGPLDIIDLCINPTRGLELIKACQKEFRCVLIQPGAESEELLHYLQSHKIDYLEGCLLVGLKLYPR